MNDVTQAREAYYEAGWWRAETFLDDLDRHARQRPGKPAVVGHNLATGRTDTIDYAELSRLTDQMARGLVNLGVQPGECVGVLLPDTWETLPLVLACVKAGVRLVPIPPEFGRAEMELALRLTDTRLLIAATETFGGRSADMALELSRDIGLPERIVVPGDDRPPGALSFAEHFLAGHGGQEGELAGRRLGPDEPFVILFTSGTTGTTKAPVHSQNTLYAEIRGYAGALGFDETLVNTTAHSNMYRAGLVTRLLTALVLGGTAVCLDTWDPAASLDLIEEHGVTTFYGSPHFVRELLAAARARPPRATRLASIVTGSAPVPAQLLREVRAALGVRMFALWGMTENGAVTCTRPGDPDDWPTRSDGRPTGGMEIRADPVDGLEEGTGALWVRGPAQCLGYYHQDDIYAAELDSGGWFSTGDLVRDDGRGGIRMSGRTKDIIIFQSANVPVAEIEAVLGKHPKVADVALIGIPSPATDETICAVVTAAAGSPPTLAELRGFLGEAGVSEWYWPGQVEVLDDMPRTPMGKIRKADLRKRYAAS
ncbi:MAG TPA: AMP-binding protein [Trebonia sp.]|jgi:cyclohexanecarboxylate-CoA ligase|nr:AMP-binding protein [Trebonia sp.]